MEHTYVFRSSGLVYILRSYNNKYNYRFFCVVFYICHNLFRKSLTRSGPQNQSLPQSSLYLCQPIFKKILRQVDNCGGACQARCRLSSRPNLCHRACGTCCARCNCVPPGTAGNTEVCPCYANMTTHHGRRKCP
ncbi:Gibberellin-regulated protein 11 [Citrus sinensis]|uniref:Gibberellin-regulated protein 11 n=1 Tax=Citrus sinensis TaxID=2711 RepID=A0ACB8KXH8_CITSI|nr:Gibberellin-regulated protein 11 [Citrus sinensis]